MKTQCVCCEVGTDLQALSYSREKRLLASSCPSVRLPTCIRAASIGRISVKFDTGAKGGGAFKKVCRESQSLVKIGQKLWALYTKIQVCFIVTGDIDSAIKHYIALGTCMLLTVTSSSVYTECTVGFPFATKITRTRHHVTLRVHCLSCWNRHAWSPLRPGFHSSLDRMRFCGGRSGTGAGNYQSTSAFLWQYHSAIVACSSSSTRCSYQKDKQTIPGNLPVQQFCTGSLSVGQKSALMNFRRLKRLFVPFSLWLLMYASVVQNLYVLHFWIRDRMISSIGRNTGCCRCLLL